MKDLKVESPNFKQEQMEVKIQTQVCLLAKTLHLRL